MMGLARQFQQRVRDYQEYNRLIEREKLQIDPHSIILMDDFFLHAVEPLLHHQTSLSDFFVKYGESLYYQANYAARHTQRPVFPIEIHQLDLRMRANLTRKDQLLDKGWPDEEIASILPLTLHIKDKERRGIWIAHHMVSHMNLTKFPESKLYGAYLGDVFALANSLSGIQSTIDQKQFYSLIQGQGEPVLQFWKDVRNLKDYSGFFPNKPKPPGDNINRQKERAAAAIWRPAFG